jgi:GTP-binding protein HflX
VEAFKATLEETLNADLLLHVIDAASDERDSNIYQVQDVLAEIGAQDIPQLLVFNKLDLLQQEPRIDRNPDGKPERVWLSAATGEGTDLLLQAISELVGQDMVSEELYLEPDQGGLRAALYNLGAVEAEDYTDEGLAHLSVRLPRSDWNRLMKKGPEPLF